jgi:hypothetical protein
MGGFAPATSRPDDMAADRDNSSLLRIENRTMLDRMRIGNP